MCIAEVQPKTENHIKHSKLLHFPVDLQCGTAQTRWLDY